MNYRLQHIPSTRIATFDVFAVGLTRHHVSGLLEFDVTRSRERLRALRRGGVNVSFTAWLIKVISKTVEHHPEAAAYLYSKRKLILFDEIHVSILVEKEIGEQKVPIPLLIEAANRKSVAEITRLIDAARSQTLSNKDIVLHKKSHHLERLYSKLPGFLRRTFWRFLLSHPKMAFPLMGNVVITSPGMLGRLNGWFIHKSVHPLSFGIGSVVPKPRVVGNQILIREILNATILFDHDVIDGAPMMRMLNDLTRSIENGDQLD